MDLNLIKNHGDEIVLLANDKEKSQFESQMRNIILWFSMIVLVSYFAVLYFNSYEILWVVFATIIASARIGKSKLDMYVTLWNIVLRESNKSAKS